MAHPDIAGWRLAAKEIELGRTVILAQIGYDGARIAALRATAVPPAPRPRPNAAS